MTVDLQASLESGPAGEFFRRVMNAEDQAPPQFVAAERVIDKAAQSGDTNLENYAATMRQVLEHTAEAEALELSMAEKAAAGPMANIGDMIEKFKTALQEALADGFQISDLFQVYNAVSAPDPEMQQLAAHRSAAQEALQDGQAWLQVAEQNGVDVKETLGENATESVENAAEKIDRIAPGPPAPGTGGPMGP